MKKQRATKQVRIYPDTHECLRKLAFKLRVSLAGLIEDLARRKVATGGCDSE
jgi:hypothetical protein